MVLQTTQKREKMIFHAAADAQDPLTVQVQVMVTNVSVVVRRGILCNIGVSS